jgi:hypothetical protein
MRQLVWFSSLTAIFAMAACGILDNPPELPDYARPKGATEVHTATLPCDQTEDWGPTYKKVFFGTERAPMDLAKEVEAALVARGWTVKRLENDTFFATSPDKSLNLSFDVGPAADWGAGVDVRDRLAKFDEHVAISVHDCPV